MHVKRLAANLMRIARNGATIMAMEGTEPLYNNPDYWQSLGKFVQSFSEVEREANFLLWQLTDDDVAVSAAIYRERMPISEVTKALERLYSVRLNVPDAVADFRRVMHQLQRITSLRNDLLHNGTTFTEQGAAIVKKLAARRSRTDIQPAPVSIDLLDSASHDCNLIAVSLWMQWQFFEQRASVFIPLLTRDEGWSYK